MRLLTVWMTLAACGGGDPVAYKRLGDVVRGGIWSFVVTRDSAPILATDHAILGLQGDVWTPIAQDGLPALTVSGLFIDSQGTTYAQYASGTLFRLTNGATTWEPFDDGIQGASVPIEASDGALYMFSYGQPTKVYFRDPGDARWTDSGLSVDIDAIHVTKFADAAGNIWISNSNARVDRVHRTEKVTFPDVWPTTVEPSLPTGFALGKVFLVGVDKGSGRLIGASGRHENPENVIKNGFVFAFDPTTQTTTQLNDGGCNPSNEISPRACSRDIDAPLGGYTQTVLVTPDGDVYETYGTDNGSSPYLLHLPKGAMSWENAGSLDDVWVNGDGAVEIAIAPDGTVYGYTVGFTGQYDMTSGAYTAGELVSTVYTK